jgi:transposase-like protein
MLAALPGRVEVPVYGRERRVLLRHYLEQGVDKAALARDLGVSRRTIYYWIETGPSTGIWTTRRSGMGPDGW